MKALVGTFDQEKVLVGAFSVIVKTSCGTDGSICGTNEHTESGNGNTGSGPGHSFQSLLSWRGATRDGAAAAHQCRARTQLQVTHYLNVKSRVSAQTRPYFYRKTPIWLSHFNNLYDMLYERCLLNDQAFEQVVSA